MANQKEEGERMKLHKAINLKLKINTHDLRVTSLLDVINLTLFNASRFMLQLVEQHREKTTFLKNKLLINST